MGVDARMYVTWNGQPLSDEDVRRMSHDLVEAFWYSPFWIEEKRGALSLLEPPEVYHGPFGDEMVDRAPEGLPDVKTRIEVHLSGRYYGIGYERGEIHTFIAIAEWFEHRLGSGCQVWYGGDNVEHVDLFDKDYRWKLFSHFAHHGHEPYTRYSWSGLKGRPECEFCLRPMMVNGASGSRFYAECAGCRRTCESTDGGVTWGPQVWNEKGLRL